MANESHRSRSKWRIALVVIGMLGVGVAAGYLLLKRFPNAFDRESTDIAEIEKLKTAKLPDVTAAVASGWPQWRGPNRDGRAPAGAFRTNWDKRSPRELWSVPCKGGYSSCSVVDGLLYTASYDADAKTETVMCIDTATAVPLWEWGSPADYSAIAGGYRAGPRSTPTVHDSRVYFLGGTGQFICLEAKPTRGQPPKEFWRHDLLQEFGATLPQWGAASSPLIEGNLVIVQPGGKSGSVAAFDRVTGKKVWASGSNPNGYSSPIAATFNGVRVVLAMTGNALLGLRAADGEVLFTHPWVTQFEGNIATPIVVDDWVFISSSYGKGCALLHVEPEGEKMTAKPVYFRPGKLMRNHHATCVHKDGFLYGFDQNVFRCINLREGTEVWDGSGISQGCVILADKYLIGLTQDGTLFLAEATPESFHLIDKQEKVMKGSECWASPVLLDGRLYLRDNTRIVCFDVSPDS
ncbi:outer membrane protein assembly factor BamB family protein [Limnoglobus roseus]|uniref:Alcohol dehydrogenase n=1 Tax=Limnoglobus roseus TaxID=2598579 RepID=A0A5C1AMX2_9BACT|nr:PQQ-binding-like beta-propeller repeat protein [Limnoglobus roseus]QEL18258.1 alcohol dehydrogenase [Limnoglobus roseus]